jgi:hypothetical protein
MSQVGTIDVGMAAIKILIRIYFDWPKRLPSVLRGVVDISLKKIIFLEKIQVAKLNKLKNKVFLNDKKFNFKKQFLYLNSVNKTF